MLTALIILANALDRIGSLSNADKVDVLIKNSVDKIDWESLWDTIEESNKYKPPITKKAVKLIDVYNAILADPSALGILKKASVFWKHYINSRNTERYLMRQKGIYSDSLNILHDWILERFDEANPISQANPCMLAMCDAYIKTGTMGWDERVRTPSTELYGRNWRDEEIVYDSGDK